MSGEDVLTAAARREMARKVKIDLTTRHRLSRAGATYVHGYARWRLDLRAAPPERKFPAGQADALEEWVNTELGLEGIARPVADRHYHVGNGPTCGRPRCGRRREHPIHANVR